MSQNSPSWSLLLIAVLAVGVFGMATYWYTTSKTPSSNSLGVSVAQVLVTVIPTRIPIPTIAALRLGLGQRGYVMCNNGMVVASRARENLQELHVTCRIPTPSTSLYPSCKPWPTCPAGQVCPAYYPIDGWCPPTTVYPKPTNYPYPSCRPQPTCAPGRPCPLYYPEDGWCPPTTAYP